MPAVVLLAIAVLAMAARRAFPFLDGMSGLAEFGITLIGVACALTGAWLWWRKAPDSGVR